MDKLWKKVTKLLNIYYEPGPGIFYFPFVIIPCLSLLLNLFPPFEENFAIFYVLPAYLSNII